MLQVYIKNKTIPFHYVA